MPQTLEGTCPSLVLDDGCQIVIEARDPVTGDPVTGVTVSNVNVYGIDLTQDGSAGSLPPIILVPAFSGSVAGAAVGAIIGAGGGG